VLHSSKLLASSHFKADDSRSIMGVSDGRQQGAQKKASDGCAEADRQRHIIGPSPKAAAAQGRGATAVRWTCCSAHRNTPEKCEFRRLARG
jgi:hypothetical protein